MVATDVNTPFWLVLSMDYQIMINSEQINTSDIFVSRRCYYHYGLGYLLVFLHPAGHRSLSGSPLPTIPYST